MIDWAPMLHGFAVALEPARLGWCLVGVTVGTAVGVLPGLGPAATIALLLPVTYQLDPVSVTLTSRMVSAGLINNEWIECTTGCPVSTTAHPTINNNRLPGATYFDMNFNYTADIGGVPGTARSEEHTSELQSH